MRIGVLSPSLGYDLDTGTVPASSKGATAAIENAAHGSVDGADAAAPLRALEAIVKDPHGLV